MTADGATAANYHSVSGDRPPPETRNGRLVLPVEHKAKKIASMLDYDRLRIRILSALTGELLPETSWHVSERNEQRIALAVCEATGMTPERWDRLNKDERIPWLYKTLKALEKQPVPNAWVEGDDLPSYRPEFASGQHAGIDTTPTLPKPPPALIQSAATEIPRILANVKPNHDGAIELIASHLTKRLQDAKHTLAAAQWAIHEAILEGRLRAGLVELEMPSYLPRGSKVWQGGERGTIAIPDSRPASFDAFKVTATESLWTWWHSIDVVNAQRNLFTANESIHKPMTNTERPSPFTISQPSMQFEGAPVRPFLSTVGALIQNLNAFADQYEAYTADIERAETWRRPAALATREANADNLQQCFRATPGIDRVREYVLANYGAELTIGTARRLLSDLIRKCSMPVHAAEGLTLEAAVERLNAAESSEEQANAPADAAPKPDLVLITVNQHETQAIHDAFRGTTGFEGLPVSLDGRLYHNLGTLNGTTVFHAISEMGSGGPGGMQQAVEMAIRALNPGAVISVGIAFGINESKQSIGDILISKQLMLYDLQRVGAEIIPRGDRPHASSRLINHFEGFSQVKWKRAKVRFGVILSGDKLIDNIDYRGQLLKFEAEALGGEMEGAGLYVTSHHHKVDWIVLKAICDWADGTKEKNKTRWQKKAAKNAAEFLVESLKYARLKRK